MVIKLYFFILLSEMFAALELRHVCEVRAQISILRFYFVKFKSSGGCSHYWTSLAICFEVYS